MSRQTAWRIWLPGSHEIAAVRRHRARHCSNLGLGKLVLFPGGAGRANRCGYRLVAGLGCRRRIDRLAGLIAPRVGSLIERKGGRPVLAASSLLYASGLAGIGLAPILPVYLLAWVVLGVGMGTGLYDAVFAALGKLYGLSLIHI